MRTAVLQVRIDPAVIDGSTNNLKGIIELAAIM